MKKIIQIWITLLPLTGFFVSCGDNTGKEVKAIRPVRYEAVGVLGGGDERTFSGTAKTDKIINLSFRSGGIITEWNMRLGQEVTQGELLAKLDNVQARLNYESAVETQNSAESQMNTAKLSLNRVRSLYEKGSSSLSDYEAAKNSYKTAVASFESAKRSVAIQQEQIRYGYLYAAEDGVIASVNAELNENVSAGQSVGILNAGTTLEIALGLPESVINEISVEMPVTVNFSAIQNKEFNGRVSEVAPSVDTNTATYPVRIQVTNATDEIKSGMAANVTFDFGDNEEAQRPLVVPAKAVGEDEKGRYVFLIEQQEDKSFIRKKHISIGPLNSEGFVVTEGLSTGQKIATAGLQTLLDGQEVKLQ